MVVKFLEATSKLFGMLAVACCVLGLLCCDVASADPIPIGSVDDTEAIITTCPPDLPTNCNFKSCRFGLFNRCSDQSGLSCLCTRIVF